MLKKWRRRRRVGYIIEISIDSERRNIICNILKEEIVIVKMFVLVSFFIDFELFYCKRESYFYNLILKNNILRYL